MQRLSNLKTVQNGNAKEVVAENLCKCLKIFFLKGIGFVSLR